MPVFTLFPRSCPVSDSLPSIEIDNEQDPTFAVRNGSVLVKFTDGKCYVLAESTASGVLWLPPKNATHLLRCNFLDNETPAKVTELGNPIDFDLGLAQIARKLLMEEGFKEIFESRMTDSLLVQYNARRSFRVPGHIDDMIRFIALCPDYSSLLSSINNRIAVASALDVEAQLYSVFLATLCIKVLEDGFVQSDRVVEAVPKTAEELRDIQKAFGKDEVSYVKYLNDKVQEQTFRSDETVESKNPYALYIEKLSADPGFAVQLRERMERGPRNEESAALAESSYLVDAGFPDEFLSTMVVLHEIAGLPFSGGRCMLYALGLLRGKLGLEGTGFDGMAQLRNAANTSDVGMTEVKTLVDPLPDIEKMGASEEAVAAAYSYEAVGEPFRRVRHCFLACMEGAAELEKLLGHGIPFLNEKDDRDIFNDYRALSGARWDPPMYFDPTIEEAVWISYACAALAVKEHRLVQTCSAVGDHLFRFSPKPKPGVLRRSFRTLIRHDLDARAV